MNVFLSWFFHQNLTDEEATGKSAVHLLRWGSDEEGMNVCHQEMKSPSVECRKQ